MSSQGHVGGGGSSYCGNGFANPLRTLIAKNSFAELGGSPVSCSSDEDEEGEENHRPLVPTAAMATATSTGAHYVGSVTKPFEFPAEQSSREFCVLDEVSEPEPKSRPAPATAPLPNVRRLARVGSSDSSSGEESDDDEEDDEEDEVDSSDGSSSGSGSSSSSSSSSESGDESSSDSEMEDGEIDDESSRNSGEIKCVLTTSASEPILKLLEAPPEDPDALAETPKPAEEASLPNGDVAGTAAAAAESDTYGKVVNFAVKFSLIEKGHNEFEFLPPGWIKLNHSSGMPLYLHQESRVCTWSPPYFIGPGSVRRHEVPLSSIPCLKYWRELEKEGFKTKPGIVDLTNNANGAGSAVQPGGAAAVVSDGARPVAEPQEEEEPSKQDLEDGELAEEEAPVAPDVKPEVPNGPEPMETTATDVGGKPKVEREEEGDGGGGGKADGGSAGDVGDNRIRIKNARLITAEERQKTEMLDAEAIRDYCVKRFALCKRTVAVFDSWRSRRVFKKVNNSRGLNRPQVPKHAKVITLPILGPGLGVEGGAAAGGDGEEAPADGSAPAAPTRRHRVFNPAGKSYVSILHEVLFFSHQSYPDYKYSELTDASTPYAATVIIQGVEYGTGYGSSKRYAKVNAAKATLGILLPDYKKELNIQDDDDNGAGGPDAPKPGGGGAENGTDESGKAYFDSIDIEDPRVAKMSHTLGEPPPFQILTTCIQRNHGLGAFNVETDLIKQPNRKLIIYQMKVSNHEVQVKCKNKREGKQLASQKILKKLHPLLGSWGALLRLYGVSPSEAAQRKHKLAQEVTSLQQKQAGQAKGRSMNLALLKKLREEMSKLKDCRANAAPIGRFVLPDDVSLPSSSEILALNVGRPVSPPTPPPHPHPPVVQPATSIQPQPPPHTDLPLSLDFEPVSPERESYTPPPREVAADSGPSVSVNSDKPKKKDRYKTRRGDDKDVECRKKPRLERSESCRKKTK